MEPAWWPNTGLHEVVGPLLTILLLPCAVHQLILTKHLQCRGKWGSASKAEVDEMLSQGKPHCYRFRVPSNETVTIKDSIRGEVSWNSDSLGDFVVLRSNGLPVYNFCVAIDDGLMKISHVIRAEEHLPNTLRQVLTCLLPCGHCASLLLQYHYLTLLHACDHMSACTHCSILRLCNPISLTHARQSPKCGSSVV